MDYRHAELEGSLYKLHMRIQMTQIMETSQYGTGMC